ncbi:hypothetical protein [Rubellimicrobium arenae]|uniref:hypothetical protein n=1 Tax=Rubellimicrobium arenae TaxID=2817372 RepID=UPI001B305C39|nr:hypothetical protein [Rubellimicrobium arenae]
MKPWAAVLLPGALAACSAFGPTPDQTTISYLGQDYGVRRIENEPRPHIFPEALTRTPDGGLILPEDAAFVTEGPAVRVSGAVDRQTASDVLALFCARRGRDVAPGWRGAPVRFDPTNADHVFYTDC